MAVSKRLRYEVLRRDRHTCRYYGDGAPAVKLTVDHVLPVALGGTDTAENLVAACGPCNAGKSASSPDAHLVAQVSDDVIRWGRARAYALQEMEEERHADQAHAAQFFDFWDGMFASEYGADHVPPLPDDAEEVFIRFVRLGVSNREFSRFTDITVNRTRKIGRHAAWSYFAGCCWNQVREIESRAQTLLIQGAV